MSWKQRIKPPRAGPYGAVPMDRRPGEPAWMRADGIVPVVGGSSCSPMRRAFGDAREEAYARYVDRISNAWRAHRKGVGR